MCLKAAERAQGRKIPRTKRTRQQWLPSDLVKLFDDPLFLAYDLPSASMAGMDAAYWLPGWRQLPWPVDDNYLGRLRSEAGPVREAGLT